MKSYTLQMDDLEIEMYLGLHDFEKREMQRVIVSATIETTIETYSNRGFFDYDEIADFIRSFNGTSIETQEELLERIHDFIMSSPCADHAVVHTRKPDIYDDAKAIGIVLGKIPFPYQQIMAQAA